MKLNSKRAFMPIKPKLWILGASSALACLAAYAPAGAQQVYKCGPRNAPVYTEKPCAGRTISTEQARVPVAQNQKELDLRKLEENRLLAMSLRRRAGESTEEFETRRRRTRLLAQDRAECARLDTRIPVETASLTNPDPGEVQKAELALRDIRKRFGELRC
jgi:hypothetical protein